jgi:hypothetical protein
MQQPSSTAGLWRCGVVIFALIAAAELAIEAFHAPRVLTPGMLSEPLFKGASGCAVYQRRADDRYVRTEATLEGAPERLDANDATVLAMRAHDHALRVVESSLSVRAALALPMAHRGELFGFVLLGPKPGGDPYRPDEIDVLQFAVHQVGLDFYATKIEQLEREIALERQTSETLRAQLQTAMQIASVRSADRPS